MSNDRDVNATHGDSRSLCSGDRSGKISGRRLSDM